VAEFGYSSVVAGFIGSISPRVAVFKGLSLDTQMVPTLPYLVNAIV